MFFHRLSGSRRKSTTAHQPAAQAAQPLSECRGCSRVKVCRISGDRGVCGRMASLGVLPGAVLELLCPACGCRRQQCMVKINGGTLSLDGPAAASIFVEPA